MRNRLGVLIVITLVTAACGGGGGGNGAGSGSGGNDGKPSAVFAEPLFFQAQIADAGRAVLFTDGGTRESGRMRLRDLATGAVRPVLATDTPETAKVRRPRWLPDGRVLFVRITNERSPIDHDYKVSIAAADGSGYVDIPHAGGDPDAEPNQLTPAADGKSYFYARDAPGTDPSDELRVAALDGSSDRLLGRFPSFHLEQLSASGDGRHLVAVKTVEDIDNRQRVVVLDTEGKVLKDLGPGSNPTWSPDGTRIAYEAPAGKQDDGLPLSKVRTVAPDGSNPLDAGQPHPYISESALMWSSVGKILFVYEGYDHQYELWSVPAPA